VGHFSVSPSPRLALETFIANQAQHHRKVSFQDEYPRLLKKYSVQFDERYVWNWIGCGFFWALNYFDLVPVALPRELMSALRLYLLIIF
jgi:hypothetical protein